MLAMAASFGIILALSFSESARHSHPTNLVLMALFTVAEGICVGAITSQYQMQAIVLAAAMTAVITVGLTLYALNTKKDFTMQVSCQVVSISCFAQAITLDPLIHSQAAFAALLWLNLTTAELLAALVSSFRSNPQLRKALCC